MPSFMLREQGWGVLSIMKTILRKTTKEQFELKVSKSIKSINLGLSQHPPSEFYN